MHMQRDCSVSRKSSSERSSPGGTQETWLPGKATRRNEDANACARRIRVPSRSSISSTRGNRRASQSVNVWLPSPTSGRII